MVADISKYGFFGLIRDEDLIVLKASNSSCLFNNANYKEIFLDYVLESPKIKIAIQN